MPTADELINAEQIHSLADILDEAHLVPARWVRVRQSAEQLGPLALSERARTVAHAIREDHHDDDPLGDEYAALASIIRQALSDPGFSGWMIWPVTEAVAAAAVASPEDEDFEDGLRLLTELTPIFTQF